MIQHFKGDALLNQCLAAVSAWQRLHKLPSQVIYFSWRFLSCLKEAFVAQRWSEASPPLKQEREAI